MRAYHLEKAGRFEGVVLRERPVPAPCPGEIVLRVHAASLNRRDLMLVEQTYPIPGKPGVVPLSDGAGEVVAIGAGVTRFKVGDRVTGNYFARWRDGRLAPDLRDQLGCTLDGMAADYAVLDEQWAVRLPDHLSWEEGACLSCAGVTAWCSVTGSDFARPGRTVLTLGTGDVSLFAVQFAKLTGCRVIVTTSSDAKAHRLRELGADEVINTYFRLFPEKTENAAKNKLPKADERARVIGGIFQELRRHLNEHASHSSYGYHSLSHLLDSQLVFRRMQQFAPQVLDESVKDLVQ